VEKQILADAIAKTGMAFGFVKQYLDGRGYTGKNLMSAIVSERTGEIPARSVEAAIFNNTKLPGVH